MCLKVPGGKGRWPGIIVLNKRIIIRMLRVIFQREALCFLGL
jgi:hypothetical protein